MLNLQFLVIRDKKYGNDLLGFLEGYEEYAALVVNWRVRFQHWHKPALTSVALHTLMSDADEMWQLRSDIMLTDKFAVSDVWWQQPPATA